MRTIKFRAWDKEKKAFYPQSDMEGIGGFYYNQGVEPEDNYVLQQFTGLLDKNGMEIWEGDIVRYISNEVGTSSTIDSKMKVFWNEKEAAFDTTSKTIGISQYGLEVIGNVMENPELLK